MTRLPPGLSGLRKPELSQAQILCWADEFHERTGRWPRYRSGLIPGSLGERWSVINSALWAGHRGLPGGSTLADFLAEHRGVRNRTYPPGVTEDQILAWADAHHQRTGSWPQIASGPVVDAAGETWLALDSALRIGHRGLLGGSSLATLLEQRRGARNHNRPPPLTVRQILAWADAHHQRTGKWPTTLCGPIVDAPGEHWQSVAAALQAGKRGLPGGRSLAQLLAQRRAARNRRALPRLTVRQILRWADEHHARSGQWPTTISGSIADSGGETWHNVDAALAQGCRGLPGGSTLAQLLARRRSARNPRVRPRLRIRQILRWADEHHRRTGAWPDTTSGPIPDSGGETWKNVSAALASGWRGLPGGSSLLRLLQQRRAASGSRRRESSRTTPPP
jgi:hypothetical protein